MSDFRKARPSDGSLAQVVQTLTQLNLPPSSRLWIAFSGGVDSTVLLQAAARVFDSEQLAVLHINHGLSCNADSWEKHCASIAARLGIQFDCRRIRVTGRNLEFEGRRARLRVFSEVMSDGDVIATAHHRDDELESLMWQLSTGRALVGIATWRELARGRLWRPLLRFKRDALLRIASQYGWSWVEDESNLDVSLTRNAMRHEVIPRLRAAFQDFESHLLKLKVSPLETLSRSPIEATLFHEDPTKVRAWLHAFDITPKSSVVEEIVRQSTARHDAQVLVRVRSDTSVRRFKGKFFVVPDSDAVTSHSIRVGENRGFTFGELTWAKESTGLSADVRIETRSRQGGESLQLIDRRVNLSKWFYDQDFPPWERNAWPMFYRDEQLVAVPGVGVSTSASKANGWVPKWRRSNLHPR